jgi:hypothetical protein
MPTPGLVPANLRLAQEEEPTLEQGGEDIVIQIDDGEDQNETDEKGNILRIEHPDGSVSISLDGKPVQSGQSEAEKARDWFRNLVDEIDSGELTRISGDLLRGIEDDIQSRQEWIDDRAQGIKLLGLKIEIPGTQGAPDGAPIEGMSKVRHPLLLEAVLRFQANARSELLPTDGPVKTRIDSVTTTPAQQALADALEKDLNHYLTVTASEYYPDTDRMLFMLGFGGTAFKKVYYCPLRNRPVSESIDADDLIVNNSATDLKNAKRVTHRVRMRPSTVKRLQILGVYRDVELSTPNPVDLDAVQREKNAQQGISADQFHPDDRDREIYECYCELDIGGFEHKWKGKETGLEIPYRVTIDVSSKEILSIVRNYDEDTEELPEARQNFVKYTFVPGMGFLDIGLLHILGNTTNAVTAAWREMLDAGMFANFPGFLMADTGARQNTNIFRVPPGGGALVKTGGLPISQAIMPLPYKEPGASLMSLVQNIAETGQRVGGTAEIQVGEGRQDAPVGTTLALIEQATKVLNAVHKRMHAAQAEEFQLLARCFREHPDSFWQRQRKPSYPWSEELFTTALADVDIVPQADPNTASHTQRIMRVAALKQLQSANPTQYDGMAIDREALLALGWSYPEQFFVPPDQQLQNTMNSPEAMVEMGKFKNDQTRAEAAMISAQARAAEVQKNMGQGPDLGKGMVEQARARADLMNAQTKMQETAIKAQSEAAKLQIERDRASAENLNTHVNSMATRDKMLTEAQKLQMEKDRLQADAILAAKELHAKAADRAMKERIQLVDLAQNLAVHPMSAELVAPLVGPALREVHEQEVEDKDNI